MQQRRSVFFSVTFLLAAFAAVCASKMSAQTPAPPADSVPKTTSVPNAPEVSTPPPTSEEDALAREEARKALLGSVNGRPYDQPSNKDQFFDYLRDSYGLPAFARSTIRALYSEGRGKPTGWGTDWAGFGQRYGSAVAITAINGNVKYGLETLFHEDTKYIPCHGCSVKKKIVNTILAEFTARHDVNGHRHFSMTPVISDFAGPIIANATWYPNRDPFAGVVATRTVFATRVGGHLFTEFVLERRHKDKPLGDDEIMKPGPTAPTNP